jgi:hypothetical protein
VEKREGAMDGQRQVPWFKATDGKKPPFMHDMNQAGTSSVLEHKPNWRRRGCRICMKTVFDTNAVKVDRCR